MCDKSKYRHAYEIYRAVTSQKLGKHFVAHFFLEKKYTAFFLVGNVTWRKYALLFYIIFLKVIIFKEVMIKSI